MSTEDLRARLEAQREARKIASDIQRRSIGNAVPTNPRRAEAIQHRGSKLDSPAPSVPRARKADAAALLPVRFTCWKEGRIFLVTLAATMPPQPLNE